MSIPAVDLSIYNKMLYEMQNITHMSFEETLKAWVSKIKYLRSMNKFGISRWTHINNLNEITKLSGYLPNTQMIYFASNRANEKIQNMWLPYNEFESAYEALEFYNNDAEKGLRTNLYDDKEIE